MSHEVKWVLDAVERWCKGYVLLREVGIPENINGRVDGLLVPINAGASCMTGAWEYIGKTKYRPYFERPVLIGVEVKIDRQDFLNGIKNGQYERYYKELGGLFIATKKGVYKTGEIPKQYGHLAINPYKGNRRKKWTASCRRRPIFHSMTLCQTDMWRILFKVQEKFREKTDALERKFHNYKDKVGYAIDRLVAKPIKRIEKRIEEDLEIMG